jgi:hypothetical protein
VIYLYCLLPAEVAVSGEGLLAMDEAHPVRFVRSGSLQAAVSEVGEEFAEANLNAHIRDLDWLSPRAVRHHDVVDGLFTRCRWLLPLTFGAIFRSEGTLRDRLQASHDELRARLEWLQGREEWDVKLSRDEDRFEERLAGQSASLQQLQTELAGKPPGTRFLLEKKLHKLRAQEAKRLAAEIRAEAKRALAGAAIEAHLDELAPAAPGQKVKLELRGAYLVAQGHEAPLKAAAEALAQKYSPLGYSLEVTGPWPAFSFASGLEEAPA